MLQQVVVSARQCAEHLLLCLVRLVVPQTAPAHPFCAPDVPEALRHGAAAPCAGGLQPHFHGVEWVAAGDVDSTSEHTAHKFPRCWGPCYAVVCGCTAGAAATAVSSTGSTARRRDSAG